MEEKITLSESEIEDLHVQYYNLTSDLRQYRSLLRSRDIKKAIPEQQRNIKSQYSFFKSSLNGTLETLISQDRLRYNVAVNALFNGFVSFRTKIQVSKYLRNIRQKKTMSWMF